MKSSHTETVFVLIQHLDYYIMPVCNTPSCRKRKDLNNDGICPTCVHQSQEHEDSICKQCNAAIVRDSKALECDKCSTWCHIACTNVPEALYNLLVCNNHEDGIKWFCHDCRVSGTTTQPQEPALGDNTNNSNTNNSNIIPVAVCNKLKLGTCPHGITGKTLVNDKKCDFVHPKICKKYTKNGPHGRFGCNGSGCNLLHPMLCNNSVRNRKCHKANCKLYHLRWTERGTNRKPHRGQSNSGKNRPNNQNPDNISRRDTPVLQELASSWGNQQKSRQTNNPKDFLESIISTLHVEMDTRFQQFENMLLRTLHRQPQLSEKEYPYLTQEGPQRSQRYSPRY